MKILRDDLPEQGKGSLSKLPENPELSSSGMNGARSEAEAIRRSREVAKKPGASDQGVSLCSQIWTMRRLDRKQ